MDVVRTCLGRAETPPSVRLSVERLSCSCPTCILTCTSGINRCFWSSARARRARCSCCTVARAAANSNRHNRQPALLRPLRATRRAELHCIKKAHYLLITRSCCSVARVAAGVVPSGHDRPSGSCWAVGAASRRARCDNLPCYALSTQHVGHNKKKHYLVITLIARLELLLHHFLLCRGVRTGAHRAPPTFRRLQTDADFISWLEQKENRKLNSRLSKLAEVEATGRGHSGRGHSGRGRSGRGRFG
eukprot:SAG31_NODE_1403_length_8489_cov_15.730751_6_plen_246_part_00